MIGLTAYHPTVFHFPEMSTPRAGRPYIVSFYEHQEFF
jgi:hypothetical protein